MFVTTAALGNISRAAELLFLSQPALSRALQEFENQLGVALFVRSTRRVTLTPAGERFLPVARQLLQDLVEATFVLRDDASGPRATVSVAVGEAFGCTVLPAALKSFRQQHPLVNVRILDDNSQGITRQVAQGEVDFGIGSPVGSTASLTCRKLLTAPIGLLSSTQFHELGSSLDLSEIERLPLLKESSDTSIVHVLSAAGSDLVSQMGRGVEVSSLALQIAMVHEGVGIAVMSALGASHRDAAGLCFTSIEPRVSREIFTMHRKEHTLSVPAKELIAAIKLVLPSSRLHPWVLLQ